MALFIDFSEGAFCATCYGFAVLVFELLYSLLLVTQQGVLQIDNKSPPVELGERVVEFDVGGRACPAADDVMSSAVVSAFSRRLSTIAGYVIAPTD